MTKLKEFWAKVVAWFKGLLKKTSTDQATPVPSTPVEPPVAPSDPVPEPVPAPVPTPEPIPVPTPTPVPTKPAPRPTYDSSGPHWGTDLALAPAIQNYQNSKEVIGFTGVGDGSSCHLVLLGVSGNYFGSANVKVVVGSDGDVLTSLVVPAGTGTHTSADTPSFSVTGPFTAYVSTDGSGAYGVQKVSP